MLRLIIWGIIGFVFYILFQIVKFFVRVNNTIDRASQNQRQASAPRQRKNPDNIIEAEYVEIDSKINKKQEDKG